MFRLLKHALKLSLGVSFIAAMLLTRGHAAAQIPDREVRAAIAEQTKDLATATRQLTVFNEPFGAEPSDEKPYLYCHESSAGTGEMNNLPIAQLMNVDIVGKRVVIEKDNSNNLHTAYDDKKNIRTLRIYAEKLEIRSPFRLPQTEVEIYARMVVFTGEGAILTVPDSIITAPDAATDKTDAGTAKDGLKGGGVQMYAESVTPISGPARFIMRGGNGQQAGGGRKAQPGTSMQPLPTYEIKGTFYVEHGNKHCGGCAPPFPENPDYGKSVVYYYGRCGVPAITFDAGTKAWPGDGIPGKPGSKPGEGGAGGDFRSNLSLEAIIDNSGGAAGHQYIDNETPGPPGTPNPSYHVFCKGGMAPPPQGGLWVEKHVGVPGKPAKSPSAAQPQGDTPRPQVVGTMSSWVHPRNIEIIAQYAEELYLSRRNSRAKTILDDYAGQLERAIKVSPSGDVAVDLRILQQRIGRLRAQLALGLDFYGNPPSWVPLLSLEIYQNVYDEDVRLAAGILYLSQWFEQKIGQAEMRARALQQFILKVRSQLQADTAKLNKIRTEDLPVLHDAIDEIARDQAFLASQLKLREQQLQNAAVDNAAEISRKAELVANLRTFGAIISLVPVAQPIGTIVGAGIKGIADRQDLWTIVATANSTYEAGSAYQKQFEDMIEGLSGLDFSSTETLQKSLKAKQQGYEQDNATRIRGAIMNIHAHAKEQLAKKAEDTVPADLAKQIFDRLKKTDPSFQEMLTQAEVLLRKKQETYAQLEDLQRLVAQLVESLGGEMRALEVSTDGLRRANAAIDLRVRSTVLDMRREADQRLRYYHYLLARAYEYRLLQPYDQSLLVDHTYAELEKAAKANAEELNPGQIENLMAPYHQQLSKITDNIIKEFSLRPKELQHQGRIVSLDEKERAKLDRGEELEINLATRDEFIGTNEDNRRIVNITVKELDAIGDGDWMDICFRHQGLSTIQREGHNYAFRHLGQDGKPFLFWKSTKHFPTGKIFPSPPSKAAVSLLLSRFNVPNKKFELFASPGLDATLVISRLPKDSKKKTTKLWLLVEYSYIPQ